MHACYIDAGLCDYCCPLIKPVIATEGGFNMYTSIVSFQGQWEGFMWIGNEVNTYLAEEVEMG